MLKLGLTLSLLFSTTALAQPKPGFAKATTFESCTTSWALACGMRTPSGETFGTAREMKHCSKLTFQPNGTYSMRGPLANTGQGTYSMRGNTVRITPTNDDGTKGTPYELVLSTDGSKLGGMTRL